MQIFLLMILSAFMGGYYYLDSPALNVSHDFLPESVRTKGLIMCVVNEHKRALDDNSKNMRENAYQFEQTSPCAKSKNVITKKFCATEETISPSCYEKSSLSETANYLSNHYFTTSVDLPKNINQNKILDFIKNMSGGLPNLGILFKTEDGRFVILNPQTTTDAISIKQVLIGANSLRKGQIVYFSHHNPAEVEASVQNTEFEALECENKTDIKVFNAEEQIWECRAFESLKKCFGDMLENANGDCIPNQDRKINCSTDMRAKFNYDASAWECQRRVSIACGEGETLSWNGTANNYVCVADAEWDGAECEETIQSSDNETFSTVRIGGSVSGYPCGPCEIHQTEKCSDECFPDPNSAPELLCAGSNCGYDAEREGTPWISEDECGEDGNCAKHKAIYWHNDTNRWKCVDCFPLQVKQNYRECLNGNIWRVNTNGGRELNTDTACPQEESYPTTQTDDSCYITENDGLYCSFDGDGGFDENNNGSGEKGFFCDIDNIDDQSICSMDGSSWAWYNFNTGECYDPYDKDTTLQSLPDDTPPSQYDNLSFGCPTGYYRFRENSGQISECKKSFCGEDNNLPALLNEELNYENRINNDSCKTGYVEILNNTAECFYCWIPPFDHTDYEIGEKEELNNTYFKAQAGSKFTTMTEPDGGSDTFTYLLATEIGADCDTNSNNYCKDTEPAHKSPPSWKRTWDNDSRSWSDTASPNWCLDNHYPSEDWASENPTEQKCPASYQTKLNGTNNGATGVLSACLYCLPEPFGINEVEGVNTEETLPAYDEKPYITAPQQPGLWKILNCNESVKTYSVEQSPYAGNKFAYNNGQCAVSSNTTGCADGLDRAWGINGWGDCEPIYCDVADEDNAPSDANQKLGAYIPVQKYLGSDAGWCIYMWRPPYDVATWETWESKSSFAILENNNWVENDDAFFITSPACNSSGYCSDKSDYNLEGSNYTWDDTSGWSAEINWCAGSIYNEETLPTTIFPFTGKLEEDGDSTCFKQAQPTLEIWISSGITIEDSPEFRQYLYTSCEGGNCSTADELPTSANMPNIPFKSDWNSTTGWGEITINHCDGISSTSATPDKKFVSKVGTENNWCLDTYIPSYNDWNTEPKPTYSNFNNSENQTNFSFINCGASNCEDTINYVNNGSSYSWDEATGWEVATYWCDDVDYGVPTDVFPFIGKLDGDCFRKAQPTLEIWQTAKTESNCPAGNCNTSAFNQAIYDACEENSCSTEDNPPTIAYISAKPFFSNWGNDGWSELEINNCGTPENKEFVAMSENASGNSCLDTYIPEYSNWNTGTTFENFNALSINDKISFSFENCGTSCEDTLNLSAMCSGLPFVIRTWNNAEGWDTNCEVDWLNTTNNPPAGANKRFLVPNPANKAILWRPDFSTWGANQNSTWDTYEDSNSSFSAYSCDGNECNNDANEISTVLETGTIDTDCYKNISSRTWTDSQGWNVDCSVNMCGGSENSNMLLKAVVDGDPISHCGENIIPAPHRPLEASLRQECNGEVGENFDCFYESGYSGGGFSYEEPTVAKCPSDDWDKLTNWNDGWGACEDRVCETSDLPSANDAPYAGFEYLRDYYPPSVSNCGEGLVAGGSSHISTKNCKYCKPDTVSNMTCPDGMHTFYTNSSGKVDCGFPAPPIPTCPTGFVYNAEGDLFWNIPISPSFTNIGTTKTYWWWCTATNGGEDIISTRYVIPSSITQSYQCNTGISNCSLSSTDGRVNCGNKVINCNNIDESQNFLNLLDDNKVACGSNGIVKGWKIEQQ